MSKDKKNFKTLAQHLAEGGYSEQPLQIATSTEQASNASQPDMFQSPNAIPTTKNTSVPQTENHAIADYLKASGLGSGPADLGNTSDLANQVLLGGRKVNKDDLDPSTTPQQFLGQTLTKLGFGDRPNEEGDDSIQQTDSPIDYLAGGVGANLGKSIARDEAGILGNEVGAVGKNVGKKASNSIKYMTRDDAEQAGIKIPDAHLPSGEVDNEVGENHRLNTTPDINYAVKGNKVIGHLGVDDDGAVRSVYVDPNERRKGIAEGLYKNYFKNNSYLMSDDADAMEPSAKKLWAKLSKQYPNDISQDDGKGQFLFTKKNLNENATPEVTPPIDNSDAARMQRASQALDGAEQARLQRAKDLGFDTNTVRYHGGNQPIDNIDESKLSDNVKYGKGFYTTDNPDTASFYAGNAGSDDSLAVPGGNVTPVYVKAQKPLDLEKKLPKNVLTSMSKQFNIPLDDLNELNKQGGKNVFEELTYNQNIKGKPVTDLLKSHGYDSVKYKDELNAFDPSQVQSKYSDFQPQAKAQPALDMSNEARMQRAKDMGFDTDKTYYHGTKSNIEAFDPSKLGDSTDAGSAKQGFFFSDNPEISDLFAHIAPSEERSLYKKLDNEYTTRFQSGESEKSPEMKKLFKQVDAAQDAIMGKSPYGDIKNNIIPAHLRIKNPFVLDMKGREFDPGELSGLIAKAKEAGHDSAVFKNAIDSPHQTKRTASTITTVFDPSQIRSKFAGFDPSKAGSGNLSHYKGGQVQNFANGGQSMPIATSPDDLNNPSPDTDTPSDNMATTPAPTQAPQSSQVTPIYSLRTGQLGVVPNEQVTDAISSGEYSFPKGQPVSVFHPDDGTLGVIPPEQAPDAFKAGYKYASPSDIHEYNLQKTYGQGILNSAASFGLGLGNTLTFGGLNQALVRSGAVDPDTINQIQNRNPGSNAVGSVVGVGVPLLGEAGAVGKGIEGVSSLGRAVAKGTSSALPEASSLAGQVLNNALAKGAGSAVEGLAYGAGNVVSEQALGDPNLNAQSAMAHIGLSGLLGGALGGVIGTGEVALPASVDAASDAINKVKGFINKDGGITDKLGEAYDKLASFGSGKSPEDIALVRNNRANFSNSPEEIEKTAKDLSSSLQDQYSSMENASKQTFSDVRPDESTALLNDLSPEQVDNATKTFNDIHENLTNTINDLKLEPELYPARYARKLEQFRDRYIGKPGPSIEVGEQGLEGATLSPDEVSGGSPKDIFEALNDLKKNLDSNIGYGKIPSASDADAQNVIKNLRLKIKTSLENPAAFGVAGARQAAFNESFNQFNVAKNTFQKNFMTKFVTKSGAVRYKVDPVKVNTYLNQIDNIRGAAKHEALEAFNKASEGYLNEIQNTYKNLPDRVFDKDAVSSMADKSKAVQQDFAQKAHIKGAFDRLSEEGGGHEGMVALALSHGLGPAAIPLLGAYKAATSPLLTIQRLAKFEALVNKTTANIVKGTRAILKTGGSAAENAAGYIASKSATSNDQKTFEKRTKEINDNLTQPTNLIDKLQNSTASLHSHAPNNAQALQGQAIGALKFLQTKIPAPAPQTFLGPKIPPTKTDINKFNRYYDVVQNPMIVLKQIRAGMLTSESVEALQAVYPDVYKKMQSQMIESIGEHNGKHIPYKTKVQIGAFLGQDVDMSTTTANIMSNQVAQGAAQGEKDAASAPKTPGAPKTTAKGLGKLDFSGRSLTNMQATHQRSE